MRIKSLVMAAMLVVVSSACGPTKYLIKSSDIAAGADAEIVADVKKDQGMTQVAVNATNLAPAARIKEGRDTFVVWQRKSRDFPWSRIGSLQYDEGSRKGTLAEASVAELAFDLQITAEAGTTPEAPSDAVIFQQRVEG